MSIQRHQPWNSLQGEIQQVFDKFLNNDQGDQSSVVTAQWSPRVDVREERDAFFIHADVPGVDPKEIEIHMDKGILTIKGERRSESANEEGKLTRIERSHGAFYRRFALPDSANPDGISAKGQHGVLDIRIPKRPESTPRRIEVA